MGSLDPMRALGWRRTKPLPPTHSHPSPPRGVGPRALRTAILATLIAAAASITTGSGLSAEAVAAPQDGTPPAVEPSLGPDGGDPDSKPEPETPESEPEREPEPITPEQASDDENMRTRLQALYDRIGTLREIHVEVEAGIVRLRGQALNLEARQQAIALARNTEGVVFVEDDLRVITDLGQRLEPAFARLREYAIGALAFVPLFLVGLILFAVFLALGSWVSRWEGPHLRIAKTAFVRGLVRQGIRFGFGLTGLLIALELLDATALVGAVLGTAGVFGLALGFAFKDIVENHLAGIMLSVRQPFAPNDHIVLGEHEGKVIRLTARETILMTHAGNHVRIPNGELYRSVVTNYSRNPRRRFDFTVSVGTTDDLIRAQEAGIAALRGMSGVMPDPGPFAVVVELGDSWVTLRFLGWVDQSRSDFGRVRSEAIRLVKLALEAAEISMPSPEYVVRVPGGAVTRIDTGSTDASEAPATTAEAEYATPSPPAAGEQDVSIDRSLDEQIAEDRRDSTEPDLLDEDSSLTEESTH